jgi:hypothetical protein
VDDIVLTASSAGFLQHIIAAHQREFAMTDMGQLHHFLGISVTHCADGLFLSQWQYTLDILDRTGMSACKPCSTPVDLHSKLSTDGSLVADSTQYRSLAGALIVADPGIESRVCPWQKKYLDEQHKTFRSA